MYSSLKYDMMTFKLTFLICYSFFYSLFTQLTKKEFKDLSLVLLLPVFTQKNIFIHYFEIQQWKEPFCGELIYCLQNLLKMKCATI